MPASPDRNCDNMRRGSCRRNDGGSVGPLTPLNRVANRHRGRGVCYLEIARVQLRHVLKLLNDLSRVFVASTLQIGVHQIIHGVQLFSRVALLVCRCPLPQGWK